MSREAGPIKHGTWYAYNRRKCRCDVCRAEASRVMRERRINDPEGFRRRGRAAAERFRAKETPEARALRLAKLKAQSRALWALARAHPDEFRAEFDRQKARLDV